MFRQITTTATSGTVNPRHSSDLFSPALSSLLSLVVITSSIWGTARDAQGAEPTVVADAAEDRNPFDFIGEVFYRRHLRRAKITREYNCNPAAVPEDLETCPDAPQEGKLTNVKELRYARYTHEIVSRARFGLYKDLELWIEMPIIMLVLELLRNFGERTQVLSKLQKAHEGYKEATVPVQLSSKIPLRTAAITPGLSLKINHDCSKIISFYEKTLLP